MQPKQMLGGKRVCWGYGFGKNPALDSGIDVLSIKTPSVGLTGHQEPTLNVKKTSHYGEKPSFQITWLASRPSRKKRQMNG